MPIAVVFTENNARVVKNPSNIEELQTMENVLIDPDLSAVEKTPPHFWVKEGHEIRPMSRHERERRLEHHKVHGVFNETYIKPEPEQVIVDRIIERIVEKPVDRIVEKIVPQEPIKNRVYQALIAGMVIGAALFGAFEVIFRR